jgi:hypothetical protein
LVIALIQFVVGLDHPARRIQKTLAVGVLPDLAEQGLHRVFGFSPRRTWLVGPDRGGEEFGRVKFGRPNVRKLRVRSLDVGRLDLGRLSL